jgi:outer membrane biosynthesis protein TonB
MIAVLAPDTVLPVEGDSERFAKVSLKDLDLEKAVKEEKIEAKKKEKEPEPPPTKDVPKEVVPKVVKKIVRERVRTPVQNIAIAEKQKERAQKKAVASVMTALENLKPAAGAGPGRSDLKALASNISAVRSPAGAAASFRVSGVIGRIGGDGVRLAGGFGGGGKDTKVGGQLLAGGSKIGRLDAMAGTGSKVRGRVSKAPARAVSTSGGQCDRAVIQNVVGANMHAVQACYERALITSPGLTGKVVFDWTIAMGGGVSTARMVSSTLSSPAVASCILALIRTWRFSPCPIGGPVEVRYPFVFRVSGF